jgi:branched-chain amino acid aminotransferase
VVVAPVDGFSYNGKEYVVPLNKNDPAAAAGPLAQRFWDTITGIQYGKIAHEWSVRV